MKFRQDLMTLVVIFILMSFYSFSAEISLSKYGKNKERSKEQKNFNPNELNILGSKNFKEEIIQNNDDNSMMISDEAKGEYHKNSKKSIGKAVGNHKKKNYEGRDSNNSIPKIEENKEKLDAFEELNIIDPESEGEKIYVNKANVKDYSFNLDSKIVKQDKLQKRDLRRKKEEKIGSRTTNNQFIINLNYENTKTIYKSHKKGDKSDTTNKESTHYIKKKPEFSNSSITKLSSKHKSFSKINSNFEQIFNEAKNEISNFSVNIINNSFLTIDDIYSKLRKSSRFVKLNKKLKKAISDTDLKKYEEIVNLIDKLKTVILKNEIYEIYLTHHLQKLNPFSAQISIDDIRTLFQNQCELIDNIMSELLSKINTDKQAVQKKIKKLRDSTSNYQKNKSSQIKRKINLFQKGNSKSNIAESFEREITQNKSIKNEKMPLFFGLNSAASRDPFKISYHSDKKLSNSTSLINNHNNNEIKKIGSIILNAKNKPTINKLNPIYPIHEITNKFSNSPINDPSLFNKKVYPEIMNKDNKTNPHLNIAEKFLPQNLIREKEPILRIQEFSKITDLEDAYKAWKADYDIKRLNNPGYNFTPEAQSSLEFVDKTFNFYMDTKQKIVNLPSELKKNEIIKILAKKFQERVEYSNTVHIASTASDKIMQSAKSINKANEHKSLGSPKQILTKDSNHQQTKEIKDVKKFAPKILNNFDTNGMQSLSNHIQKKGPTLVIKYNPEVKSTHIQHPQSSKRVINLKNSHLYFGLSPLKKYEISEIFYGFIKGLNKDLSSWFEREKDQLEVDAGLVINCFYNNSEFLSFYDESVQYIKSDTFENLNISLDSYISFKEVASKIYGYVTSCSEKYAQINKSLTFLNFSTIESFIKEDIQKVEPNISEINGTLMSIKEDLKYKRYEDIGKAIGKLLNKIFNLTAPVIEEHPYKPPRIISPRATGFPERNAPSHPNRRMEHMGRGKGHFFGVSSFPQYREKFKRIVTPHMTKTYLNEIRENINMLP